MRSPLTDLRADRAGALLVAALLALGAGLRLWQYAAAASQWLDELVTSRAIVALPTASLLLRPLPFGQLAPKGFLAVEKLAATLAGPDDYALRLLPLLCSLAALWLAARLARLLLPGPLAVALGLGLVACQPTLIRYAAQVKPYSGDLAVALALYLYAARFLASPHPPPEPGALRWEGALRQGLQAALTAVVAVLLSNAAALTLAGLAAGLVAAALASGRRRGELAGPGAVALAWVAVAGAAALAASHQLPAWERAYLAHFWSRDMGPRAADLGAHLRWFGGGLVRLGTSLGYPWLPIYGALALIGIAALWRQRRALTLLVLAPLAAHLVAADLGLYPLADRLTLDVLPVLLFAVAAGAAALASFLRGLGDAALGAEADPAAHPLADPAAHPLADPAARPSAARARIAPPSGAAVRRATAAAIAAAAAATAYGAAVAPAAANFAADPPIYRIEETKPLLRAVAARRLPGDAIYVYYGAAHALAIYGPRYGFQPPDYVQGGCHRGYNAAYRRELDAFRGRSRLWVIVSHAQRPTGEEATILAHLDRLGRLLLALRVPPHSRTLGHPAEAFLYDLHAAPAVRPGEEPPPAAEPPGRCLGPVNPDLALAVALTAPGATPDTARAENAAQY